ncbi:hypothetical protein B0T14DRAFT_228495 [Immersiella caudata]|uniref:Uncharacterized protein n=1 Tax=Immersiella caudata TaxID=314043 RepID=A0AA40C009_9PEZI|nr:hypothetical protein B0T14DRAFT_228495 [Immersiella caudata]
MDTVSPKSLAAPEPLISLAKSPGPSTNDGHPQKAPPTPPQQDYEPAQDGSKQKRGSNDFDGLHKPFLRVSTTPPTRHPPHSQPWHPRSQAHHIAPFTPISPPPTAQTTSLDDLHNERTYLLQNLQRQGERATRLLERYAALEAKVSGSASSNGTVTKPTSSRKTRKELATLKGRLVESSRQEQLMLLRLGEIWLEVRNRERWLAVAGHVQHHAGGGAGIPPTPATAASTTSTEYFACSSALSPLSPSFVPGKSFSLQDIWGSTIPNDGDMKQSKEDNFKGKEVETEDTRTGSGEATVEQHSESDDAQEDCVFVVKGEEDGEDKNDEDAAETGTGAKTVMFKEVIWELNDEDADSSGEKQLPSKGRRLTSLHLPLALGARDKRMSLPSLKTIWRRGAGVELDQDEDEQFLGPL